MNQIQAALSQCESVRIAVAAVDMTCERGIIGKSSATIPAGITVKNNIATIALDDASFISASPKVTDQMGMMVQSDSIEIAVPIASILPLFAFAGGTLTPCAGDIFRYENLAGGVEVYEVFQRNDTTDPPYRKQSEHGQTWIIKTKRTK